MITIVVLYSHLIDLPILVTGLYILIAILMILEKTFYTFDWPIKTIYSLIVPINWSSILVIALQIINTGIMIIITAK